MGWGRPAPEMDCRDKEGPPAVHPRGHNSRLDTTNTFIEGALTRNSVREGFPYSLSFDMYFLSTFYMPGAVLGTEDTTPNKQTRFLLSLG